jgi:PadR family transcriptional regulator, regulatory protein PadR
MNTENAILQMKKGVLEMCVLSIVAVHDEVYPADIRQQLKEKAEMEVVEGTLYPLLTRLKNAGHLTYTWQESQTAGPPRKYYKITEQGNSFLDELRREWNDFTGSVDKIVNPNDNLIQPESEQPSTEAKKKKKA